MAFTRRRRRRLRMQNAGHVIAPPALQGALPAAIIQSACSPSPRALSTTAGMVFFGQPVGFLRLRTCRRIFALTQSGDLFDYAKDLFVGAKQAVMER